MNNILLSIAEMMAALKAHSSSPLYFTSVASTPHGIRRVFFGDPQQIPMDDFPAIAIRPVGSRVIKEATRKDMREHTIEIVIIENLRNYSETTPTDPSKVQSLVKMMEMMEKADSNQQISEYSILGKMLKNPRMPYTDSGTKYAAIATHLDSIDYVFNISRGFPTFEVIASFRILSQGDRA